MPVIKELRDIVELLGEHDAHYQRRAVEALARILDMAEEDISEGHLSYAERKALLDERVLAHFERRAGKARADALRARLAAIKGEFDDLDDLDE